MKKVGICNSLATKIEPQEKFLVVFEVRVNLNTTTGWTTAAHSTGAMAAHGDLICEYKHGLLISLEAFS